MTRIGLRRALKAAFVSLGVWVILVCSVIPAGAQVFVFLNSISPNVALAGGPAFTLTVTGSGFVPGSVVRWNGSDRTTTFGSANSLTAMIPASDIALAGTVSVTVFNPAPGEGVSNPRSFAIITPGPPDLLMRKSHVGNFIQGQTGAQFTLAVENEGDTSTSGAVTVVDNVPSELMPTAAAGAGWICNIAGQAVTCTRSDPLAPGASYGPVTITVNVAPTAPPVVVNTATISGGGRCQQLVGN
jgi:Domain of unknown function DUF11